MTPDDLIESAQRYGDELEPGLPNGWVRVCPRCDHDVEALPPRSLCDECQAELDVWPHPMWEQGFSEAWQTIARHNYGKDARVLADLLREWMTTDDGIGRQFVRADDDMFTDAARQVLEAGWFRTEACRFCTPEAREGETDEGHTYGESCSQYRPLPAHLGAKRAAADSPRIISGFAARALPLGSVLVRAHNGRPVPDAHAVVKVLDGWWAYDGQSPEPLAGDIEFVVLHVPQPEQVRPAIPSRPSWRPRTFFTGPRRSFADGTT